MATKHAIEIKDVAERQRLFKLEPPIVGYDEDPHEFVVSSICSDECAAIQGCYETYLFGADKYGRVQDWCELPGSQKTTKDLRQPLIDLGYEIVPLPAQPEPAQ